MDTAALHTVEANGITLACRAWGPADAPSLVLSHCRGADGGDWAHLAERLAEPRVPAGCTPPTCAATGTATGRGATGPRR
ncbi:hypothetical protein GCM10010260_46590 [Streptomyces filipinensis]|uniref:Uncharacterized protein n=1 Tax=Streptomyces filipinensis TaxID=66887 RepID=A0A918MD56_9ACTN|nr:hypothetical protein [Streptomyces filipinensis]GGV04249.1 hypothetical protein GCM10010260_46590 [Streptomyces filipinensis]